MSISKSKSQSPNITYQHIITALRSRAFRMRSWWNMSKINILNMKFALHPIQAGLFNVNEQHSESLTFVWPLAFLVIWSRRLNVFTVLTLNVKTIKNQINLLTLTILLLLSKHISTTSFIMPLFVIPQPPLTSAWLPTITFLPWSICLFLAG